MLPVHDLPAPAGVPFDLLADVTVLDLTTSIAGPYATMLLGDMGAAVIKLERPVAGDDSRHWGPPFHNGVSPIYLALNRNKRSLALDYTSAEGRAILEDLVRIADVVVTNQVPRVQQKLGTDYATLAALKADLVYVALTGYGLAGERSDRPCYDLIAEGYASIMDMTGAAGGGPQKVGTPAADMLAGMDAAYGALAALYDRAHTGRGRLVDVALVDSMTRFMAPQLAIWLASGQRRSRSGATDSPVAIYQVFDAADAPFTLGVPNDTIWQRFCAAVGRADWADDPRYRTNADRVAARPGLIDAIQAMLIEQPRHHWLELFATARVPAGPINRMDETTADRGLLARGLFYRLDADGGEPVPQINTAIHIDGASNAPRTPPPGLGDDGPAVLRELLGRSDDEIAALVAGSVI